MLRVVAEPDQHPAFLLVEIAEDLRFNAQGGAISDARLDLLTFLDFNDHFAGLRAVVYRELDLLADFQRLAAQKVERTDHILHTGGNAVLIVLGGSARLGGIPLVKNGQPTRVVELDVGLLVAPAFIYLFRNPLRTERAGADIGMELIMDAV